jgi:hypothetical protein
MEHGMLDRQGIGRFLRMVAVSAWIIPAGACGVAGTVTIKEGVETIADRQYLYRPAINPGDPVISVSLPATVSSIGAGAFENNAITALDIPPLVSHIRERSFRSNSIEKLFIPPTVKRIGAEAFSNNRISALVISEGVETIDDHAFAFNPSLKTVNIPESVASLSPYAFDPGVILTGKEQFRRTPENSYIRITTSFNSVYRHDKNPNTMKVDGQQAISGFACFVLDTAKDIILAFDIHNTRSEWTDLAIKHRFVPGHEYELVFEEYELTFRGARGEMLEFIVIDQETGTGSYWQYAWRDGEEAALEMAINYQRLMGVYRSGNGFESGQCRRDGRGHYTTLANKEFRGKVPRFLHTGPKVRSATKNTGEN